MTLSRDQEAEIEAQRAQSASTRRPTAPALEEILFQPLPVLDHGFVRVIDYMGDDAAIVQAARVSYGKGTTKLRDDRGLIRYLMRHRHTTPFEMAEIKLHVKLPIFVARQWIRHRMACLTGDAQLCFDLPGAARRGRRSRYVVSIEQFHRLWTEGTSQPIAKKKPSHAERVDPAKLYSIPELARLVERREEDLRNVVRRGALAALRHKVTDPRLPSIFVRGQAWLDYAKTNCVARVSMRQRLSRMRLRMCDEITGEIGHTRVTGVSDAGVRPVFRVTLENGNSLTMTSDHRCLTDAGWMTLEQATRLRLGARGSVTWNPKAPRFAVNGVAAHRDRDWLRFRRSEGLGVGEIAQRAGVSYHTIRKSLQTFGLQFSVQERSRLSGRARRGERRTFVRGPLSAEALRRIRKARSGPRSNFWKGGIASARAGIGAWTAMNAARVHERNGHRCAICGGKRKLNAHHVDPVWHNPARARDIDNLATLCDRCHKDVHRTNLELDLLRAIELREPLADFWDRHPKARPWPVEKPRPRIQKLMRTWSAVARIEYAGEQRTYDIAVSGPFHNFVANGFIVHNSVNEQSSRYSILDREFYLPSPENLGVQSKANRQGRGEAVSPERAAAILEMLKEDATRAYDHYLDMLNLDDEGHAVREDIEGVARELARMDLTLNYYTQWYWKIDLHNLLHFLSLRIDDHAQEEIRAYARVIGSLVERWVPAAFEAFSDYRLGGTVLSRAEIELIRRRLRGDSAESPASDDAERLGLSKREIAELGAKLPELFAAEIPGPRKS